MSKHADFFNGINLYGQDIINFKPHQVSSLPLSPFLGQLVFLDAIDGAHPANQTYQYDGTEWLTITHHDLTIAASSTDYLEISGHELSIKQLAVGKVLVDNTYTTLALWVTGTTYDGSQMQEGDILILQAATAGQKTYIHKSGNAGNSTDFVAMFDELTATEVRSYLSASDGLSYNSATGAFVTLHDHNTINVNAQDELYVVDDGITGAKLNNNTAGDGLSRNATTKALDVNVDGSTIELNADALRVKTDGITKTQINADVAGNGLGQNADGSLEVNVDSSTIEINADTLRIKDLGVTEAKLATAVTTKLNDSYTATVGDGAASSFTVTHSFGTRYVLVGVANISDDYKEVWPTIKKPSDNTVTIDFGAEVPTSNQYAITIKKAV